MKRTMVVLALFCAPQLLACATSAPERGPTVALTGQGPVTERVQSQVRIIDAKLSAVEQLCEVDGAMGTGRCSGPLERLKRRKAYYRQRANALLQATRPRSDDDAVAWQELEVDLERLTIDVDELARDIKYAG